jgi:4-amino-4-deoxy-L-arabinose transferase-like glycosyltransferase
MQRRVTWLGLGAIFAVFAATAFLFVPRLGIEADEAMIANGIYGHGAPLYSWKFGGAEVPVMLISYLGALKTWIYNPYFAVWPPSPVSLRLPAVLAGVVTIWLFFNLLDRVAGRQAAWIGALLLATDSTFLLVETTDFGFVALQFVLKLSAILLLLRYDRDGNSAYLAGGFFLLGLALWDKAVSLWVLGGLAVATLVVFPRHVWRHLTKRNLAVAVAFLVLGALPLLIYNVARPFETLRANVKVAADSIPVKATILSRSIDGSALFGFVTAAVPGPRPAKSPRWVGGPRHNLIIPAMVVALAAVTLCRSKTPRFVWFSLVASGVTWLFMAFTAGAGGAVQHTILLWPFPLAIIAATMASLPAGWAGGLTALLCLSNLAVTSEYYVELINNGPAIRWTDAIGPLERYLSGSESDRIMVADWGIIETLSLLSEGRLPVYSAEATDSAVLDRMIASSGQLYVAHTPEFTFEPATRARLEQRARNNGFEVERITTISDRHQRPTFEVFRFRRSGERK